MSKWMNENYRKNHPTTTTTTTLLTKEATTLCQ
jgi:hypothetical protein